MRTAHPPVGLGSRDIRLPELTITPEKELVLANALSLSRGIAALGIFVMSLAGASAVAVVTVASVMWLTDVLDGKVARMAWRRGARRRTDGAALDPMMDDLAFICGFLVLLNAGVVPFWFVAGLLASRVLFAVIRFTVLAHGEPFAQPEPVTKFNGAVLAIGQLLLLAHVGFPRAIVAGDGLDLAVIVVMTTTTAYSVARFAIWKHGRVIVRLLTP